MLKSTFAYKAQAGVCEIMASFRNESTDRLFETMNSLSSVEEFYAFFEDLCTIKEIQDMAQRLDTVILLDKGESYNNIAAKVGVSTATISRVSKCLNYGSGGYKNALKKMKEKDQ